MTPWIGLAQSKTTIRYTSLCSRKMTKCGKHKEWDNDGNPGINKVLLLTERLKVLYWSGGKKNSWQRKRKPRSEMRFGVVCKRKGRSRNRARLTDRREEAVGLGFKPVSEIIWQEMKNAGDEQHSSANDQSGKMNADEEWQWGDKRNTKGGRKKKQQRKT